MKILQRRLLRLYRAASDEVGITFAIFFGLFSTALAFASHRLEIGNPSQLLLWIPVLATASFCGAICLSGLLALYFTLSPTAYARVMIEGRPPDEIFLIIAWHIAKACRRFLRKTAPADELSKKLRNGYVRHEREECEARRRIFQQQLGYGDGTPREKSSRRRFLDRFISRLVNHEIKQHTLLQKIETMKHMASEELEIPPRRLCDHIFRYSPSLHRDRTLKYLNDWKEIRDSVASLGSADEVERFGGVSAQLVSIRENVIKRLRLQEELRSNVDLHQFIYELASTHSTSGSLQSYARLVAFTARREREILARIRWDGDPAHPAYRALEARLLFVERKQRAHPGFDLNVSTIRLCQEIQRNISASATATSTPSMPGPSPAQHAPAGSGYDPLTVKDQLFVLERLRIRASVHDSQHLLFPSQVPYTHTELAERRLRSLEWLPSYVTRHVAEARARINDLFVDVVRRWSAAAPHNLFLVTHGYSKTVREALRRGLVEKMVRRADADPSSPSHFEFEKTPPVFLVIGDDKDAFDTRLMEHELRDELLHHQFGPIASGSLSVLLGMLGHGDRLLVVLGAECFDADLRVVHPRGMANVLQALFADERVADGTVKVLVVVVAEEYKFQERSLADTEFFDDHLDRIDLYQPGLVHLILTDRCSYPVATDWEAVVDQRLR